MTGNEVRNLRLKLKLTQTRLAYGLGVSIRTVTSWESRPTTKIGQGYDLLLKHLSCCHTFRTKVNNQGRIVSVRTVKKGRKEAWKTRKAKKILIPIPAPE